MCVEEDVARPNGNVEIHRAMAGETRGVSVGKMTGAWRVFLIKDKLIFLDGKGRREEQVMMRAFTDRMYQLPCNPAAG